MPEILAIDLAEHRVCGVMADVSDKTVRIVKSFAADVPEDAAGVPPLLGIWLAETLKRAGISARQVLIGLPREDVVVRHLELPQVDDVELPNIVRFQAATKSTVPLDQLALDYLPLPQRPGFAGRDVLLVTVPQERIGKLYGTALAAGLEVVSVGVSSVSTAEIVLEAEANVSRAANEISLVVSRHGDRIEISLVGQGHLYFSHSTQVAGQPDQITSQVLSEVSRAVIALGKRVPNVRVAQTWLVGSASENAELTRAAHERFGCEVTQIDPFQVPGVVNSAGAADPYAAFAGPIGQLLGHSRQTAAAVDFLNPRRPVVKKDYTQHKRWAVAAAVGFVLISAYGYRALRMASLAGEVAEMKSQLAEKKKTNEDMKSRVDAVTRVDQWVASQVNWLNETQQLTEMMEGTERRYLRRLQFGQGTTNTVRGSITATGSAKERTDVEGLNAELLERSDTDIEAQPIKPGKDSEFPFDFQLDISLKKPTPKPPEKPAAEKPKA